MAMAMNFSKVLGLTVVASGSADLAPSAQAALDSHALGAPTNRSESDTRRLFAEFQLEHGSVDESRFGNFVRFVELSDKHPTNPVLQHGSELSRLATLSQEEFEASYRDCSKISDTLVPEFGVVEASAYALPTQIDWRTKNAVTPVKDQGQCGSCWTFSTTGVLEGAWAVAGHGLTSLSEQNLVSCDNMDGNLECKGGWPYKAIEYVHSNGIDTEASYPYTSGAGQVAPCMASQGTKAPDQVAKHVTVQSSEAVMAAWVAQNGPLSVSVDAMTSIWWPYRSGVLSTCYSTQVDHAVLIVGFGVSTGQPYWLIKNSWNANWGESGYIRLQRGTNQCGITYQPVGAIVGSPWPTPPTPPTPPSPPSPPTPPTPPTPPSPSTPCPSDAKEVATPSGHECQWLNGTNGVEMPTNPTQYCDYIGQGYLGYSWSKAQGDIPCPSTARRTDTDASSYFCLWQDGQRGVKIPKTAVADCSKLSQGTIGFILPSTRTIVV